MSDDRFDEFLQRAARTYNEPPPVPRDAMWAHIDAERRSRRAVTGSPWSTRRAWLVMAAGMAAALLLGIGLGVRWHGNGSRVSAPVIAVRGAGASGGRPTAAAGSVSTPATQAFDAVAAEHLGRAEVLLTSFQLESQRGAVDPQIGVWAGDLLSTTRLLLDSPSANDPQMRQLLGDLEVVLAQIAQLQAQHTPSTDDLQIIDRAVHAHDMMTRLRNATPSVAIATGS